MTTPRPARRPAILAVLGALGLVAVACGGAGAATSAADGADRGPDTSGAAADVPGTSAPVDGGAASNGPVAPEAVVAADRRLAAQLYHELAAAEEGNLFFSPYSIGLALSLLEPGAAGATGEQLRDLLGVSGHDGWHDARHTLHQQVVAAAPAPDGFEPLRLAIANGAFGQAGFPFEEAYLDRLATSYGAALEALDFGADPEAARRAVNAWVAERTEGHIADLLPDGSITTRSRLVLANAVFFSGNWLTSFDEARTAPAPFTRLDGTEVSADTMHGSVRTSYGTGDGWAAARLPYAGGSSMLVVVPDAGRFAEVEGGLGAVLDEARALRNDHQVALALPRFDFASGADLAGVLQRLGVVDAFDPERADLTGIAAGPAGEDLYVSGAFHRATVAVDEHGTTATAATGIVAGVTSMPQPAALDVDRPFFLAIEHDGTGELLFLGRVLDPTA